MKHADRWIYTACRTGQTGTSGYQTYTRSPDVDAEEQAQLARAVAFVARSADRPEFSAFGWNVLSTGRGAFWQSQQGAFDDLGRSSFFSEAFVVGSSQDLQAPPYAYFSSQLFRAPLSREEVNVGEIPALLTPEDCPELPLSGTIENLPCLGHIADRLKNHARRALILVSHLLCGGDDDAVPSVLVVGSPEDTLAVFALLWEATRHCPPLRRQLSLCTLMSESNAFPFVVGGRPANWGKPSPQFLARFSTRFGWDATDKGNEPIHISRPDIERGLRDFYAELLGAEGTNALAAAGLRQSDPALSAYPFLRGTAAKAGDPKSVDQLLKVLEDGQLDAAWQHGPAQMLAALSKLKLMDVSGPGADLELTALEPLEAVLGAKCPEAVRTAIWARRVQAVLNGDKFWADNWRQTWLNTVCGNGEIGKAGKEWAATRPWIVAHVKPNAVGTLCLLIADEWLGAPWASASDSSFRSGLAKACESNPHLPEPTAAFFIEIAPEKRAALFASFILHPDALRAVEHSLMRHLADVKFVQDWSEQSPKAFCRVLDAAAAAPDQSHLCTEGLAVLARVASPGSLTELLESQGTSQSQWRPELVQLMLERLRNDAELGRHLCADQACSRLGRLMEAASSITASDVNGLQIPAETRGIAAEKYCAILARRGTAPSAADMVCLLEGLGTQTASSPVVKVAEELPLADLLTVSRKLFDLQHHLGKNFYEFPKLTVATAAALAEWPDLISGDELVAWHRRFMAASKRLPTAAPLLEPIATRLHQNLVDAGHSPETTPDTPAKMAPPPALSGILGKIVSLSDSAANTPDTHSPEDPPAHAPPPASVPAPQSPKMELLFHPTAPTDPPPGMRAASKEGYHFMPPPQQTQLPAVRDQEGRHRAHGSDGAEAEEYKTSRRPERRRPASTASTEKTHRRSASSPGGSWGRTLPAESITPPVPNRNRAVGQDNEPQRTDSSAQADSGDSDEGAEHNLGTSDISQPEAGMNGRPLVVPGGDRPDKRPPHKKWLGIGVLLLCIGSFVAFSDSGKPWSWKTLSSSFSQEEKKRNSTDNGQDQQTIVPNYREPEQGTVVSKTPGEEKTSPPVAEASTVPPAKPTPNATAPTPPIANVSSVPPTKPEPQPPTSPLPPQSTYNGNVLEFLRPFQEEVSKIERENRYNYDSFKLEEVMPDHQLSLTDSRAVLVDLKFAIKDWRERAAERGKAIAEFGEAVQNGNVEAAGIAKKKLDEIRKRSGWFLDHVEIKNAGPATSANVDALVKKAAERKMANEQRSTQLAKLLESQQEIVREAYASGKLNPLKGLLNGINEQLDEFEKVDATSKQFKPWRSYREAVNLVDGIAQDSQDTTQDNEHFLESLPEGKTRVILKWRLDIIKKIAENDRVAALEDFWKYYAISPTDNNRRDWSNENKGWGWQPFLDKVKHIVKAHVGDELLARPELPIAEDPSVTKKLRVWYAQNGNAADIDEIVILLQQAIREWEPAKKIKINGEELRNIPAGGVWGRQTLNAVLALENNLDLQPVTGKITNRLLRHKYENNITWLEKISGLRAQSETSNRGRIR